MTRATPPGPPDRRATDLEQVTFAFLDVETTGLDPAGDRVCEVAVLRSRGRRVIGQYQTLINPGRPIPIEAQRVNRITDQMVEFSPRFAETAEPLAAALAGAVAVCHNAPFDTAFLDAEFRRAGRAMPRVPVMDTLVLARKHFRFASNNLGAIARALGVEAKGWHRAFNDVQILKQVFEHFLDEFRKNGLSTLSELLILRS